MTANNEMEQGRPCSIFHPKPNKKAARSIKLPAAFLLKALAKRQMWLLLVHIKGVPASTLPASGQRPDALYLKNTHLCVFLDSSIFDYTLFSRPCKGGYLPSFSFSLSRRRYLFKLSWNRVDNKKPRAIDTVTMATRIIICWAPRYSPSISHLTTI